MDAIRLLADTTVSTATQASDSSGQVNTVVIQSVIQLLTTLIGSGPYGWLVGFVVVLGIGAVFWWLKAKYNQAVHDASEAEQAAERAKTGKESEGVEKKWDEAQKKTDEVRDQNPDDGKTPRT